MEEAHQIYTEAWLKGKPRSIELMFQYLLRPWVYRGFSL